MSTKTSREYDEGWEAYDAGKSETACPYEIGSTEAMDWNDGFAACADATDEDGA